MAKNKRSQGEKGAKVQNGEAQEQEQFEARPPEAEAATGDAPEDAAPFMLAEVVAASEPPDDEDDRHVRPGQFNADDMEFEAFMFDAGDGRGIVQPVDAAAPVALSAQAEEEQAADTAPTPAEVSVSGEDVPLPSYVGAFVPDPSVPQSPPSATAEGAEAPHAQVDLGIVGGEVPQPISHPVSDARQFPTSAADWNDQLLASVDDFSQVLMALRTGAQASAAATASAMPVPLVPVEAASEMAPPPQAVEIMEDAAATDGAESEAALPLEESALAVAEAVAFEPAAEAEVAEPEALQAESAEPRVAEPEAVAPESAGAAEPSAVEAEMELEQPAEAEQPAMQAAAEEQEPLEAVETEEVEAAWAVEDTAEDTGMVAEAESPEVEEEEAVDGESEAPVEAVAFEMEEAATEPAPSNSEREDDMSWKNAFKRLGGQQPNDESASTATATVAADLPQQAQPTTEAPVMQAPVESYAEAPQAMGAPPDSAWSGMEMAEQQAPSPGADLPPRLADEAALPAAQGDYAAQGAQPATSGGIELPDLSALTFGDDDASMPVQYEAAVEATYPAGYSAEYPAEPMVYPDEETAQAFVQAEAQVEGHYQAEAPLETFAWGEASGAGYDEAAATAEPWMTQVGGDPFLASSEDGAMAAAADEGAVEIEPGTLNADDLEFEEFMFDAGSAAPLPALPGLGGTALAPRGMESVVDPGQPAFAPTHFTTAPEAGIGPLEEDGPLPFWLQENATGGDASTETGDTFGDFEMVGGVAVARDAISGTLVTSGPLQSSGPLGAAGDDIDYSDLPPIEPFDFSLISVPEKEEELGFNTEELTGTAPPARDPMMVTANLDVLADLLGKDRTSGVLDVRSIPGYSESSNAMAAGRQQAFQEPQAQATAPEVSSPLPTAGEPPTSTWTAVDSGALSMDNVSGLTNIMSSGVASPDAPPAAKGTADLSTPASYAAPDTAQPAVVDVVVDAPQQPMGGMESNEFNRHLGVGTTDLSPAATGAHAEAHTEAYTGAEMDAPTGTGTGDLIPGVGISTGDLPSILNVDTGGLLPETVSATEPMTAVDLDVAPFDLTQLQLEEDEESSTSFLNTMNLERNNAEASANIITETLFREPRAAHPGYWEAPQWIDPQKGANAVRVEDDVDLDTSRFAQTPLDASSEMVESDELPTQRLAAGAPQAAQSAAGLPDSALKARVSRFNVQGAAQPSPAVAAPAPAPASAPVPQTAAGSPTGATSGPLPSLPDFQQMEQIVASRPNDPGAHMALAVAYSQSGHVEHAMNQFKWLLKLRQVPAPILQMVEEQLTDMESEASSFPRFHQVRGDLYMKQGRFQDAIEEYNRVAQ